MAEKKILAALMALTMAGCASGTGGGGNDDGGAGPDAALPHDDASEPDVDAAPELPDAAPPEPDAAPVLGIQWPADSVFPHFAILAKLDVMTVEGRPGDITSMLVTLQGIVNRQQPRIYLLHGGGPDELWLDELGVDSQMHSDPFELVGKYKAELAGVVITDPAQPDTLNLATTIAGIKDGIVVSPALATTLTAAPYSLPIIDDLRTHHFTSNLQIYQYQLDVYGAQASHRLLIGLHHGIAGHLRDYAVATRALTFWLNPTKNDEIAMLKKYLALVPPNSPYLGWWTSEPAGVHLAATYGVPVYAADFSRNLTVLGGSPRGSYDMPAAPAPPQLENKIYVCIFMSDGDNLQEDQGLIPLKWARPERGRVPTAWTVNPALVDVAPVILRYFQRTATINDVLVSGPSGLGYTYPAAWPAGKFESYAQVSGKYMGEGKLRVATVWNNGADLSEADANAYLTHVPGLQGLTIQDATTALKLIGGKIPLLRMQLSYGDTEAILASGVDAGMQSYNGSAPVFLAVQGNMNMGTISPEAFAALQNRYAKNTNVVFVRPDHFFHLLAAWKNPPAHELHLGDWNGDGKIDPLFYYGGNGDFWVGESDGAQLVWHAAAHTASFGNLLDGKHELVVGDFDGNGKSDVAFYQSSNDTWRIGTSDGTSFVWQNTSAGTGGNALDGSRRISVGDYSGDGKADLLVYNRGDGSMRVGVSTGTGFTWHLAASVGGFGNLLDGSHVFYDGDWNGDGKMDVMFHYNGDSSWWMGLSDGNVIDWHVATTTGNFGNLVDGSHRVLVGDWNGDKKTDLLFHYNGNGDWYLGASDGNAITWSKAGNTAALGAGNLLDWGHRLYVGDEDGDGKSDVLAYASGTGKWYRGTSSGTQLTFTPLDETGGFGDLVDPSRALFLADFTGDKKLDALFYYNGDGNWWLRKGGVAPEWKTAGNTSGFGDLMH